VAVAIQLVLIGVMTWLFFFLDKRIKTQRGAFFGFLILVVVWISLSFGLAWVWENRNSIIGV